MLILVTLLAFLGEIQYAHLAGKQIGPIGTLDILRVDACEAKNNLKQKVQLKFTFNTKTKVVNGNINIPFNFDESITFKGALHKWTGSEWKKNMMKWDGKACDYLNNYLPKIFADFQSSLDPKVKTKCTIQKGNYKINNLIVPLKHLELPMIVYGKLKAEFKAFKGKETVLCIEAEADSKSALLAH
ncbi:PREDICTED: uncharacterized protein LOC108556275 [Nicrophorus vespilloides]|uniref:Uncharacterized protein LOC108556275 n=1 Tax=Nicrophorus vespilloides TaxID=110193 RepID=A0ABM1LZN1_NICVS|nr:PREDICTED: uncharacterized protein LOC108556275 [Nicrophorus vespilloides]